jgi:hypothetical protein
MFLNQQGYFQMKMTERTFGFKAVQKKDEITGKGLLDEKGEKVMIPAAEAITKEVPLLELPDIVEIIERADEKEVKLLLESVNDQILAQCKEQIDESETARENIRENGFNLEGLTWTFIANIPPGVRGGAGIPKEEWEEFSKDYIGVMIHHGKTEEKAQQGAKLLLAKLTPVKFNRKVLTGLQQNMRVWIDQSSNVERFQKIYEYIMNKLDTFLATDEDALANSI